VKNAEKKQLFFKEKYASKNQKIRDFLYSFDKSRYIIKNSTGVGLTHLMCNYTLGNLIILSPNNSMILAKAEGKYDCEKYIWICGEDQGYKHEALLSYLRKSIQSNVVVNLNAEQLLAMRDRPELWEYIQTFNVFIDECHAYMEDSNYRPAQGEALELIYNECLGKTLMSTATPIPFSFDVPKEMGFETIHITRNGDKVKEMGYSENRKDARTFIVNQIKEGRKVLVFSNNKNIHTSKPLANEALKYVNLVGDNLRIKIQKYDRGNPDYLDPDLFKNADIVFLSSAYFQGYDFHENCSIVILSEQSSQATKININKAVQCYGRCRKTVYEALYINVGAQWDFAVKKPISFPTKEEEVLKEIERYDFKVETAHKELKLFGPRWNNDNHITTLAGYVNRGRIGSSTVQTVNDYYQFNPVQREELFKEYNFKLYPYEADEAIEEAGKRDDFGKQINNLYRLPGNLLSDVKKIKSDLKYKDVGTFNFNDGLITLSVYLIKKHGIAALIKMMSAKEVKPKLFYGRLNHWLRVNAPLDYLTSPLTPEELEQVDKMLLTPVIEEDHVRMWHMLYSMYNIGKGNYDEPTKRHLGLREIAGEVEIINEAAKDRDYRTQKAKRAAVIRAKEKFGKLSPDDLETISWTIESSFQQWDRNIEEAKESGKKPRKYQNFEKQKYNQKKLINLLIQLLNGGKGQYASKVNGNREYGAITEVSKQLRHLIPLKYIEFDMVAANPQCLDRKYGSQMAFQVYNNVMEAKGVDRATAKIEFNKYLNNHYITFKTAFRYYKDIAGYPSEQARSMAKLSADGGRGRLFEELTKIEKDVMKSLQSSLSVDSLRLHDALIIPSWQCKDVFLPTLWNGFRFDVKYFNSTDEYIGLSKEIYSREFMWSDLQSTDTDKAKVGNAIANDISLNHERHTITLDEFLSKLKSNPPVIELYPLNRNTKLSKIFERYAKAV